jgi:hypothetical protein
MNAALDIMHTIQTAGISLRAEQGKIVARPASRLTPALRQEIVAHKNDLLAALIADRYGLAVVELRELAGKDWPELEANPELLECFADMVSIRKMREKGIVPPTYTAVTVCAGCGPVPIFPGVAKKVEGCPWCLNRAAGRPVPRVGAKNAT